MRYVRPLALMATMTLSGCGTMLPGTLYTQDGKILPFEIEVARRTGAMTATDPLTQEHFSGSYVGIMERVTGTASAVVTNGNNSAVGFGVSSFGSNIANATAYLRGDQGTMLTCAMQIEAGLSPHGIGGCDDNKGGKYRLQF